MMGLKHKINVEKGGLLRKSLFLDLTLYSHVNHFD